MGEAAADKHENIFLPIDIPQHVKDLIRSAVGESTKETIPVHSGVVCDGCGMNPIQGRRYMSLNRPDFDTCSECHNKIGEEWSKDPYISFYTPFPDMQRAFMGHFMNMMPHHGFGGSSGCRNAGLVPFSCRCKRVPSPERPGRSFQQWRS